MVDEMVLARRNVPMDRLIGFPWNKRARHRKREMERDSVTGCLQYEITGTVCLSGIVYEAETATTPADEGVAGCGGT